MIKEYLQIGKITSTHGVRGEVRIEPWCDSPEFLKKFKKLYFDEKGEREIKISCRPNGKMSIGKIEGIDTVEKASALRNKILYMKRSDVKLSKENYFIAELIDCTVVDFEDEEKVYGKITDVSQTGANDVWHITDEKGREYLIPAIPIVLKDVDVETGIIKISPLKGIFEDEN